jgi:hypothetical protein
MMAGIRLKNISLLSLFLGIPFAFAHEEKPFVETKPRVNLKDYLKDGKIPKFIKVNLDGYHVRTSADFDIKRSDNIDFKNSAGSVYAVRNVIPMTRGVAVNVVIDGKDRFIYVPGWKKEGFQFCESEACFSSLAEFLKILQENNITGEKLSECGITIGADGNPIGEGFEATVPDLVGAAQRGGEGNVVPKPREKPPVPPRKDPEMAELEQEIAPRTKLKVKAFWETSKPPSAYVGKKWTEQLLLSLDTYGKDLINQKDLGDKRSWCPRYAKLSAAERREFWAHLMIGVAERESNFKTGATYNETEGHNEYRGKIEAFNFSQGLFQLSYGSASQKTYRNYCKFDWKKDRNKDVSDRSLTIYDVKKQMNCAVGILNHWVKKDKGVGFKKGSKWRGGSRFWSTLRSSNPATKKVQNRLKRFKPCFQ